MSIPLMNQIFHPVVTDGRSMRRYVGQVTGLVVFVVLGAEIPNQLIFFVSWSDCWREWALSLFEALALSIPLASSFGRAHLVLYRAKREAEMLSLTDPLTGLANRRAFYETAAGFQGGAVALAIADIDRFKRINDRNGHATGDAVLKSVAAMMRSQLGDLGMVARLGGEEFALISTNCAPEAMRERLQAFRQCLAATPTAAAGVAIEVTVSIGFACRGIADLEALYSAADTALYVAKSAGRDRVVDYDEIGDIAPIPASEAMLRAG